MADGLLFHLESPASDIAVITINDPKKGANILSRPALAELDGLLTSLEKRTDLAGLIIRSTKPGNYIAGADLREFVADIDAPAEQIVEISRRGQQLFARLSKTPFVTIAAIEGICVGGGAELAVWCDRRIMAAGGDTGFGFPEVKIGIYPGWGGTARAPRIIGLSNAIEIITSGENIDAQTAAAMGLVSDVTAGGDALLNAAIRLARAEQQSKEYLEDRCRWFGPINISETELGFLGATASAYIQGQTKGHYPAPLAALEVMIGSAGVDVETACHMEAEGFPQLFGSPVNRALLNVFFLRDLNKKAGAGKGTPRDIRSVSVIGAGVMGQGIAAANIKRGIPVALGDTNADAVGRGVQGILTEASFNKQTKGPDVAKALALSPLINGTMSDAELAAADLVVEAIYENAEAKRELYARLEKKLPAHAVLCSNTSTIPISDLAAGLVRPEQFCGLHFFNPVRKMPLVEVIRGRATSDDTIATAAAYARRIGKSPIIVNDGPGFLVNRVLLPYMNEALLLLEEGASIKSVDRAATAFGMPMGPITLYDTVGLDVALHAGGVMRAAFPDRVVPSTILPAMVEAGRIGKKRGGGFFNYSGKRNDHGSESPEAAAVIDANRRGEKKFAHEELADRLLLPMLLEATRVLEDGVAANVRDVDLALIYGIGFPPFRGGLFFWADTIGAKTIVEKLKAYESLGARFAPTKLLLEHAKSGKKFYDA
ncbi:3-hydroxyacyl-CoA dehydrogenase NAD-binding domain-containing protein [Lacipirellula limnantheis]|uniref:enoyl-CoA hydratase n=1 Tax=Lacipirellula limnantheis TaxID=2528024 RepID=A0A517TR75_9BACT|nr:3-hydroxyacyl-CoA dehydrogenase NAD-binding domain-containing protein [Lacipirellula limnantheis]QDT70877.1 Fatty acid oxidation complex subunit alpha [Lacipirellula limnantheis]